MSLKSTEEWRPVVGHGGGYAVSSLGQVCRIKTGPGARVRILKQSFKPALIGRDGYFVVSLSASNRAHQRYVHHLVAAAFIGPRPNGMNVNHIDGDKRNNRATNLEYVTQLDNVRHALASGMFRRPLSWDDVEHIRTLPQTISSRSIARQYGVTHTTISRIRRGLTYAVTRIRQREPRVIEVGRC